MKRPPEPEFAAAQRASVLFICEDDQSWGDGWARIDGDWLHYASDEDVQWATWPRQFIRQVMWHEPILEDEDGGS